jgi:hypothetical protein
MWKDRPGIRLVNSTSEAELLANNISLVNHMAQMLVSLSHAYFTSLPFLLRFPPFFVVSPGLTLIDNNTFG